MKILSCGAGMQSTALALMSCENKLRLDGDRFNFKNSEYHEQVPIYDAILFCDLGEEPHWVYRQVNFIKHACEWAGIPFYILDTHLYDDWVDNFGKNRTSTIPFWTLSPEGKKGKMNRACTLDYKIKEMHKFIRWELLGYRKYQRLKPEDKGAHEMHIGFSKEEQQRIFDSKNELFVNKFPLCEMNLERKDNYAYIRDVWGLETKASACSICPFHRNYFFKYIKKNYPEGYKKVIEFDELLEREQPNTKIYSKMYISRSRKRIKDLTEEECNDKETFEYKGEMVWNGF